MKRIGLLALGGLLILGCRPRLDARLGPLPDEPVARYELGDVRAEIVFSFVVDPGLIASRLPTGLRMKRLRDLAAGDARVAAYLTAHPAEGDHVLSDLGFVSLDTFKIDGVKASPMVPLPLAFWWAAVDAAPNADPRLRGGQQQVVELAAWYPDPDLVQRLRSLGVAAYAAQVDVAREDYGWRVQLLEGDAEVSARCRLRGERQTASYPLPAYTTAWDSLNPKVTTVFTYAGHREQPCDAELALHGVSPLLSSLQAAFGAGDAAPVRRAVVEDGWSARAAVYRQP
jgi:hypothetical protein